jgi:uncharacterized protein involved in exopolysaccharide biosynthesis
MVQATAAGYVAYLTAPATVRQVAEAIGERPSALRGGLGVAQLPATATLEIAYTTGDPDLAARGANAMAAAVEQRAVSDPVVFATVLAQAPVPNSPSGPDRTVLVVAGMLLASLVGAATGAAVWVLASTAGRASRNTAAMPAHSTEAVPPGRTEAVRRAGRRVAGTRD